MSACAASGQDPGHTRRQAKPAGAVAPHLILAAVRELLEDVASRHAEVLGGEEEGTGSDEAAVCQGSQRCPLSIRQASSCMPCLPLLTGLHQAKRSFWVKVVSGL